jgi:hypothetical protein
MILLGLLAGLSTFFAAGYGVTMLLWRGTARPAVLEGACLSWILGTGAVSLLLWCGGIIASGLILKVSVMLMSVAMGLTGWKMRREAPPRIPSGSSWRPLDWVLAALIVLEVSLVFFGSMQHTLGWDGVFNWEIKAHYAFLNRGVLPTSYFQNYLIGFSHPRYPMFIPMTELWLYLWMGEANQFWIKIIFPIYYAAGAFLLALLGTRLTGRRWVGYTAAGLLFFVPFVTSPLGGVVVGYADFPLGVVYFVSIAYLLCFVREQQAHSFRLYLACLALLPWVKNDGTILWLSGALCGAAVIYWKKLPRLYLLWLPASLGIWLSWRLYLSIIGALAATDFHLSLSTLSANSDRIVPIICALGLELVRLSDWSIFWVLVVPALILLLRRGSGLEFAILFTALVLPIAMYSSTYVFSIWPSYTAHVATSLSRLLLQLVPLGWLIIALALRPEISAPKRL